MERSLKEKIFKGYVSERIDNYIESIEHYVVKSCIPYEDAETLLTHSNIEKTVKNQFHIDQLKGGITTYGTIFINNKNLEFVTGDYINRVLDDEIEIKNIGEVMECLNNYCRRNRND